VGGSRVYARAGRAGGGDENAITKRAKNTATSNPHPLSLQRKTSRKQPQPSCNSLRRTRSTSLVFLRGYAAKQFHLKSLYLTLISLSLLELGELVNN